ncbi:CdaR family protein [Butyrivibrio sp. MC2013]|uniref:CdaR family protein n=1 Tax=Butyrivibrio sp. MC2013 TaxID=1280686 RepID=UPI0004139F22|nr:CdaR family protein [Butyrivibrio sp. MC2013]
MKILKFLTNNWKFKLASFVLAVLIWFFGTNINDPVDVKRISNVEVIFKNTSVITDAGEMYQVLDDSNIIGTVTIKAPRSVTETITRENITAVADFQRMNENGSVPIELSVNKSSGVVDSVTATSDYVYLSIENRSSKILPLGSTTSGTVAEGYIVSSITTDQNQVRISGPQSVIDRITSASVDVDVTNFTSNIGTDVSIQLYDAEGELVRSDGITMNMTTVRATVTILQTKAVPIAYHVTGTPADGFIHTGIVESDPESVIIAGKSSALSKIDKVDVQDALDVTGLTSDLKTTISLDQYLPAGISFGDSDFNGIASVVVDIAAKSSKNLDITSSDVTYDNVPENYSVTLGNGNMPTTYSVTIEGLGDTIENVSTSQLNAVIDLADLTSSLSAGEELQSGTYMVSLHFSPPQGVEIKRDVQVRVTVKAPASLEDNEEEEEP